jgi:hypothetical protein
MINVKHIAQTDVIGIPEEYADAKSKSKKKMNLKRVISIVYSQKLSQIKSIEVKIFIIDIPNLE